VNHASEPAPAADGLPVPALQLDPGLELPTYAHPGDAGADLYAAENVLLGAGERRLVGTGVALALPEGYAGFVHPRSGLAARHGLTIVNAPGTVDSGYRGEIRVCLLNTDADQAIHISRGDRIAQLVIQPVVRASFQRVERLTSSRRGEGGHGSTGGMPSGPDLRDAARDEAGSPARADGGRS